MITFLYFTLAILAAVMAVPWVMYCTQKKVATKISLIIFLFFGAFLAFANWCNVEVILKYDTLHMWQAMKISAAPPQTPKDWWKGYHKDLTPKTTVVIVLPPVIKIDPAPIQLNGVLPMKPVQGSCSNSSMRWLSGKPKCK